MLLQVLEERGVTVLEEEIQNFFLCQYFLDLMEDVEMVLIKLGVHLLHLERTVNEIREKVKLTRSSLRTRWGLIMPIVYGI